MKFCYACELLSTVHFSEKRKEEMAILYSVVGCGVKFSWCIRMTDEWTLSRHEMEWMSFVDKPIYLLSFLVYGASLNSYVNLMFDLWCAVILCQNT
jgi:hypothetical protein